MRGRSCDYVANCSHAVWIKLTPVSNMNALDLAIKSSDYLVAHLQLEAAASLLERYLLFHPPHTAILNRLGQVRLLQGRSSDAATLLKQALLLRDERRDSALAAAEPMITQEPRRP